MTPKNAQEARTQRTKDWIKRLNEKADEHFGPLIEQEPTQKGKLALEFMRDMEVISAMKAAIK